MKRVIRTDDLMVPIAHFSHGLRVGDEIHLGATAGTDRSRRLAGSPPGLTDARAQADQMYRNMKLALQLLGGRLDDVVRLKTYLTDWRDKAHCDEAYVGHFLRHEPAHATVGSWGFPLPFAVIEAELTAVVRAPSSCRYDCVAGEDSREALARLESALASDGLQMKEVVHVNVTLADVRDCAALEQAFRQAFRPPYPARTVSAAPLADGRQRVALESASLRGGGEPVEPRGIFRLPEAASPGMRAGAHLFLSAQAGLEADGHMASGVVAQTRAAWRRIYAILEAADMEAGHVVRVNNRLTDWRCYGDFNRAYGEFVQRPYPPRTTVVAGLAEPLALVHIETLAHRGAREATVLQASTEEDSGW